MKAINSKNKLFNNFFWWHNSSYYATSSAYSPFFHFTLPSLLILLSLGLSPLTPSLLEILRIFSLPLIYVCQRSVHIRRREPVGFMWGFLRVASFGCRQKWIKKLGFFFMAKWNLIKASNGKFTMPLIWISDVRLIKWNRSAYGMSVRNCGFLYRGECVTHQTHASLHHHTKWEYAKANRRQQQEHDYKSAFTPNKNVLRSFQHILNAHIN